MRLGLRLFDENVLHLRVLPNDVDATRFGPVFSANSYAIAGYRSPASSPSGSVIAPDLWR
jgi:hypothetical protein